MVDESKPTRSEDAGVPTLSRTDAESQGLAAPETDPDPAASRKRRSMQRVQLLVIVLAAGIVGYAVGNFGKPYVPKMIYGNEVELLEGPRTAVILRGDEPRRGPEDALVTIIAFSDFQCPYCAQAHDELQNFLNDWEGEPVRVIYKNYPLPTHAHAIPAARAAWSAHMQGKFEAMQAWLYEHRGNVEELTDKKLEEMGLDVENFKRDQQAQVTEQAVDDDRLAGGKTGIRATPTFVVNGHLYKANWTPDVWEDVVDWELKAARELIDKGIVPRDVYKRLIGAPADGKDGGKDPNGDHP